MSDNIKCRNLFYRHDTLEQSRLLTGGRSPWHCSSPHTFYAWRPRKGGKTASFLLKSHHLQCRAWCRCKWDSEYTREHWEFQHLLLLHERARIQLGHVRVLFKAVRRFAADLLCLIPKRANANIYGPAIMIDSKALQERLCRRDTYATSIQPINLRSVYQPIQPINKSTATHSLSHQWKLSARSSSES